jgi:ankyrin repeat protein
VLIQNRANLNAQDYRGWTPLIHAASAKERGIVKLLLEKGADPNIMNRTGYAALMYALDDTDLSKILIAKGADVNIRGAEDDVTPLVKASVEGHYRTVELLLNHKADVNARDRDGKTALHWALKFSHNRVAQLLKDHGATE